MAGVRSLLQYARVHRLLFLKNNHKVSGCPAYSSQNTYKKPVFQPSLGENDRATFREEVVVDERKTLQDLHLEKKAEMKRVRKLSAFDKRVLVLLGKYKSVKDVPNEFVYRSVANKEEASTQVRQEILGGVFKYAYLFEYTSLVVTFSLFGFAFYMYSKYANEDNPKEKKSE